jgi:hypothetical protein
MSQDRRDDELDSLLAPLRDEAVPVDLVANWQRGVHAERGRRALSAGGRRPGWRAWLLPVTASLLVGFGLGMLAARRGADSESTAPSTTIETIYAKAE